MAERRMFAKSIVLSDAFLDMPMSARCLYFTFSMFADDDGFVGSPKAIMRQCGASQDDISILLSKRFILGFESGVIVIKHWRINNYLRSDRYQPTTYLEELTTLETDSKNAYREKENGLVYQMDTNGIPLANQTDTNGIPSIGKDSIGYKKEEPSKEGKKKSPRFSPPTLEEVHNYATEKGYKMDCDRFIDFYQSKNWYVGKNKMSDWKAAVRNWASKDRQENSKPQSNYANKLNDTTYTSGFDPVKAEIEALKKSYGEDFYNEFLKEQ